MPFGLRNSGATLVKGLRKLLRGRKNVEAYMDDLILYNENWEDHLENIDSTLKMLKEANLTLRPSKCIFGSTDIEFIGHKICEGYSSLNEDNIEKIKRSPIPKTKKQVQSFLGLAGYYRDYIQDFSTIAAPLSDLTKKGLPNKIPWNNHHQQAFNQLIDSLTQNPILRLPNLSKPFVLRTDASDVGLGAILLQEYNSTLFPVSFASKKLSSQERKYSTSEKECLAIVWAINKYDKYLHGTDFTLQTDHEALKYLECAKFNNARIMRWAIALQPYHMKVEHIRGSMNCGADYLSRQE